MEHIPGFMVFWMQQWSAADNMAPHARHFEMSEMSDALTFMGDLRKYPENQFVTMVSQNSNQVGKAGADAIVDGKTPAGEVYDWNMSGRIGKIKRGDRDKLVTKE